MHGFSGKIIHNDPKRIKGGRAFYRYPEFVKFHEFHPSRIPARLQGGSICLVSLAIKNPNDTIRTEGVVVF